MRNISLLVLCSFLVACGGGGGPSTGKDGGGSSSGSSSSGGGSSGTESTYTRSADYNNHWGLEYANAETAYEQGLTGAGVLVVVMDTGVDSDHPDLEGAVTGGYTPGAEEEHGEAVVNIDCASDDACDTGTHGTLIAGVLAGRKNGEGTHGVAYNSSIFSVNVDRGADNGILGYAEITDTVAWDKIIASGSQIVNHSYGTSFIESRVPLFEQETTYSAALKRATAEGITHVYAAGNDSADTPSMNSLMPLWHEELQNGGLIAVVALAKPDGNETPGLASYSNQCGDAAEWCLAAPSGDTASGKGLLVAVAGNEEGVYHPSYDSGQDGYGLSGGGTSAAAPFVSGALALLKEKFPYMKGTELAVILLDTATDLGEAGTDAVYGRGAVDIGNALAPQGSQTLAVGTNLESATKHALSESGMTLPRAIAGALAKGAGEMVYFDKYDRAFSVPVAAMAQRSAVFEDGLQRLSTLFENVAGRDVNSEKGIFGFASERYDTVGGTFAFGVSDDGAVLGVSGTRALLDGAGSEALHRAFAPAFLESVASEVAGTYAKDGLSLSFGAVSEPVAEGGLKLNSFRLAAEYAAKLGSETRAGLGVGVIHEDGSALGIRSEGALDFTENAQTGYAQLVLSHELMPRLSLVGEGTVAVSHLPKGAALLSADGPMVSLSAKVGLAASEVFTAQDTLSVWGGVPHFVAKGGLRLDAPTGRLADGTILREERHIDLAPTRPPVEVRAEYTAPLNKNIYIGLTGGWRTEAVADDVYDIYGGLSWHF